MRLSLAHRVLLTARIGLDAVRVWRGLRRRRLPDLVSRLDPPGRARHRLEARHLGKVVYRVMNVGPFEPRCLTMALVLYRELRRQGTPAQLVIGLPPQPTGHAAHAWVEVDRHVVGPPPGRMGHLELARYGGEARARTEGAACPES